MPAVEISCGELLDKISILRLKASKISDANKLTHIHKELDHLESVRLGLTLPEDVIQLERKLNLVNTRLWDTENRLRRHEMFKDFGAMFVLLARSVYKVNDQRAKIKKQINLKLYSKFVEEKSYTHT